MIRQAFVHIGGEKTGTTTLQAFLSRNAALLRKAGFYYPCEPGNICFENDAHFPVAASLIDREVEFVSRERQNVLSSVLAELTRRCSTTDGTLILSCEHLSSRLRDADQLRALREALPTDDIKIVFYAREPSELALASWSTGVQCGDRRKFTADGITPKDAYFNHLKTLDLWAGVFGSENMIVREYDRAQLTDRDIRRDFCEQLGIELDNPHLDGDYNQSLDLQRLEVLRHINGALPLFGESPDGWREAQNLRRLIAACIPEGESLGALLSGREAAEIKTRFSEANHEMNERYFGGRLSDKWFPSDVSAAEEAAEDAVAGPDIMPALRDTIIRIAELTHRDDINEVVKAADPAKIQSRRRRFRGTKRKLKEMMRTIRQKLWVGPDRSAAVR
ncbi:MAG: hypothetical protein QM780_05845 [Hyphomicrobium sp.]|uniref:hypothetical protein n=1 Tax=Hyphomicrobium sp. TaxID=82 RepID=UPI0039E690BE